MSYLRGFKLFQCVLFLFANLCISLFASANTSADQLKNIQELREIWRAEDYEVVLPMLIEYRKKEMYGKNAEIDYMIATSLCRLQNFQEDSSKYFKWILHHYFLTQEQVQKIQRERTECANSSSPIVIALASDKSHTGSRFRGKSYYNVDSDNVIGSDPITIVKQIPQEEFRNRLYPPSQHAQAISGLNTFLEKQSSCKDCNIISDNSFIVASTGHHSKDDLVAIASRLGKYLHFYSNTFSVTIPENLITIILVPSNDEFRKVAEEYHGINISHMSIGYSFQEDLSLVCIVRGRGSGTLAHELFHLLVREKFGDIPAWMDEGMAALFEVSEIREKQIFGIENWRGKVLENLWSLRPSIKDLVEMDWLTFDGQSENKIDPDIQGANHATARYFIFYLQEQNKLKDVFQAFYSRNVRDLKGQPGEASGQLLESTLGKNLEEIDLQFTNWFKQGRDPIHFSESKNDSTTQSIEENSINKQVNLTQTELKNVSNTSAFQVDNALDSEENEELSSQETVSQKSSTTETNHMRKELLISVLVDCFQDKGINKEIAEDILDTTFETITKEIKEQKHFTYPNFGSFMVNKRKSRIARNPQTGTVIKVKESKTVHFKPSRQLYELINSLR
ncbi:MAG: HU family DNA-binding protein [Planctomycetota bacterium]|jgi:nucleoid DNA-binding protein